MLFIYLLLMLKDGCCQEYPTTDTKTVYAGEYVRMTCARRNAGDILWIRIKSGNTPEILNEPRNIYSHIKVGPVVGFHVLQITKVRLSDSGFYFCLRVYKGNRTFMNITSLTVIESAVTTVPTSVPAHLHDSVTLHCSALRDSQNNSCPEDENLLCFRADSIQTFPGFNSTDNAEESGFKFYSEGCLYSHFRNFSLSDAQMYHCAVTKDDKNTSTEKPKTITEDTVALQVHEPIKGNPESQKSHEDLVYSSVSTKRKASKKRTGATASEEQDVIYTEVNVLGV
uniref:Immunoglobulin domain-containing protein n=1 Tax=Poecilia reticulata TaxID=8081 RepID=A0A3P9PHQ3_POERE